MAIAPAPSVIEVAELVAQRRDAQHQLAGWLGVPSRKAHRQADRFLDVVQAVGDELVSDRAIR
jgi:hypothetical protein